MYMYFYTYTHTMLSFKIYGKQELVKINTN